MSLATKEAFKRCVLSVQSGFAEQLALDAPSFADDGFLTIAQMEGGRGRVELWCGPAEYHVELFLADERDERRWSLADLLAIPSVRRWIEENPFELAGRPQIAAEVEETFRLLREAVGRVPQFSWLLRAPDSPVGPARSTPSQA